MVRFLNMRPLVGVRMQQCPACDAEFAMNDGGKHLRGCEQYQQRQREFMADYEDENGVWWRFNLNESEWEWQETKE